MNDSDLKLAIKIHGELVKLVQPATPETIVASNFRTNWVLQSFIVGGVLSAALVVVSGIYGWHGSYQIIGAAGLGITFQSLYAANKYLKKYTFNPRYNQGYIINYGLGMLAGIIFGIFGEELLGENSTFHMGPPLMALLGAYSAEAVAQILQRVSETLVTFVQGAEKDKSEAKAQEKIIQEKAKITKKLSSAVGAPPNELKSNIEIILKELTDSRS
jgi:hypothetical protein